MLRPVPRPNEAFNPFSVIAPHWAETRWKRSASGRATPCVRHSRATVDPRSTAVTCPLGAVLLGSQPANLQPNQGFSVFVGPVRIPVAVLQNPRVSGGFRCFWGRAPQSGSAGWGEERVEALCRRLLAARDEVSVAVPGLADIAVSGPRRDLLPVETGGDEVGDRAVSGLVWRDRLAASLGRFRRRTHYPNTHWRPDRSPGFQPTYSKWEGGQLVRTRRGHSV
jgi:hypothetical protein